MSVYKEPRITNAFAGIHSTRNRIFCLPADRTECGSIIVRSDPVIAAPAILFLAESETVMNRSAARGVDFPFAVSWRSHSGACPFGRTGEFPRQYAIRLSKSGGGKYAFTSIGKIIGASEPVLRRSHKISPHPVFHTFLAFDHLKITLFTKSLQFTRGLSCKKKNERDIRLPKARMSSAVFRCPSLNSHRKSESAPPHFYWQKNWCFHNRFEIFFEKLFSTLL